MRVEEVHRHLSRDLAWGGEAEWPPSSPGVPHLLGLALWASAGVRREVLGICPRAMAVEPGGATPGGGDTGSWIVRHTEPQAIRPVLGEPLPSHPWPVVKLTQQRGRPRGSASKRCGFKCRDPACSPSSASSFPDDHPQTQD